MSESDAARRLDELRAKIVGMQARLHAVVTGYRPPARPRKTSPADAGVPQPVQDEPSRPALEAELGKAHEQAQLMASWAQDAQSKMEQAQTQLQQVLLEADRLRSETSDLRRLAEERRTKARDAEKARKELEHLHGLLQREAEDLRRSGADAEQTLAELRASVSEQTKQLRAAEQKEERLLQRVRDLKRGKK